MRRQDQLGLLGPMRARTAAHASERQENQVQHTLRCSREDDGSIGDIFAKVEIVIIVSNMCIGYSWTWTVR